MKIVIDEIRKKLFETIKDNYGEIYETKRFLSKNGKKLYQIIGAPGVGKTHLLVQIHDSFKTDKKIFLNKENVDDSFDIKEYTHVFIDGINEFSQSDVDKIFEMIKKSTNHKFITTSWDDYSFAAEYKTLYFMPKTNYDAIARHYNKIFNFDTNIDYLLRTLTYRQLITLFSNVDSKIIKNNFWDSMQKAYENIINSLKIPNFKGNKWKFFKKNFIVNNTKFPYVASDVLSVEWKRQLIKFNVLQQHGDDLYFINNAPFLFPLLIRDYTEIDDLAWVDILLDKYSEDILPILVWYFVARKNVPGIERVINNTNTKIKGSTISSSLFKFDGQLNIKWQNILFDKLFVFFDILPFISEQEAIDILSDSKVLSFKISQSFPNDSSRKYSRSSLSQFKKLLIGISMKMFTGINDRENIEISRLINMEKYQGIQKMQNKYLIKSFKNKNSYHAALIIIGFKNLKLNPFINAEDVIVYLKKHFFFITESTQPHDDLKNFIKKINRVLTRNWSDRIQKKQCEETIHGLFYITDKSLVLEQMSRLLHEINNTYNFDKYKNSALNPFITYIYFMHEGNSWFENMGSSDYNFFLKWVNSGEPIQDSVMEKIEVSRVVPRMMEIMLSGRLLDTTWNDETPYFKLFDDGWNREIEEVFNKIHTIISNPFFLNDISISKIYEKTIITKCGVKFYPIHFYIRRDINGYRNLFMTAINVRTLMRHFHEKQWWMAKDFPFVPILGNWNLKQDDFLYYLSISNGDQAIYTSNKELTNRWFEFYADSCKNKGLKGLSIGLTSYDYKEERIVINHFTQETSTLNEFKKISKYGGDEYKNYLSELELKNEEFYETNGYEKQDDFKGNDK